MSTGARVIRSRRRDTQVRDLLQSLFAGELLQPSGQLWLVSPWISDIPILDNSAGQFMTLVPEWGRASVRFSQVLRELALRGAVVHVATNLDARNAGFLERLAEFARETGAPIRTYQAADLHEKGLLGDGYYLAGSFNFTVRGIEINEEVAHLHTDPNLIVENRAAMRSRWGDAGR